MALPQRNKDPQERLDFGFDWNAPAPVGPWLTTGDTVATSTWSVTVAPDNTLTIDNDDKTTTVTRAWVVGGTLGQEYTLTNHVTTAQGRQAERSIVLRVVAR